MRYKTIILIFLLALGARLAFTIIGFSIQGERFPVADDDAGGYQILGKNLYEHGTLSLVANAPYPPTQFRQPLYPLFIAGLYAVGANELAVSLIQNVLDALTVVLIWYAGKNLFKLSDRSAAAASLLYAFEPYIAFKYGQRSPEVILIPLILAATWVTLRLTTNYKLQTTSYRTAALAGLLWGLVALTRASFMYFPPILAIALCIALVRRISVPRTLGVGLVFLALWGATITPWIIRNHARFGTWTFSNLGSSVVYHYTYAYVEADRLGIPLGQVMQRLGEQEQSLTNPKERLAFWDHIILQSLRDEPLRYAKILGIHLVPFFITDGINNIFAIAGFDTSSPTSSYAALARGKIPSLPPGNLGLLAVRGMLMAMWFATFLLALRGLYRLARSGEWAEALLLGIIIFGAAAIATLSTGLARYRHHIAPLLFLLAASAPFDVIWIRKKLLTLKSLIGI